MGVCAIRIDERLIHGQVATLWQGAWNCNRIMVIDSKSANDPILKSVLKIACCASPYVNTKGMLILMVEGTIQPTTTRPMMVTAVVRPLIISCLVVIKETPCL